MGGLGDKYSTPLIDSRRNLVIRGLVSDYQGIFELRGFAEVKEDLAGIEFYYSDL